MQHDYRRTKSGDIDRRTRAYRERAARMDPGETVQMIRLIVPAVREKTAVVESASAAISAFRAAHPELGEMERAFSVAMEANNEAVLPLFGLLAKLREADPERAAEWADYLNGKTEEEPR